MEITEMSDGSSFSFVLNKSSNSHTCLKVGITMNAVQAALLVALYIFVLYFGLQRWRKQRSFKSASHADIFTYHVAALELICILALSSQLFGADVPTPFSATVAYYFIYTSWHGMNFFHVLTCVERYLAVVHPIVYMRLRNARGVRIRNISIVCVWILSPVGAGFNVKYPDQLPTLVPFALCLGAVCFCSLSVLHVLVRPGPGDGVPGRERVDPAKQRAFVTITAISVVLWFYLAGLLSASAVDMTDMSKDVTCFVTLFAVVCHLCSSMVLPLLYLHRAGKLTLCLNKNG